MSYLIKERLMMDNSVTLADSAVAIEEDFSEKKEEMIEDSAFLEAKKEDVGVVGYSHFPGDNVTEVWLNIFEKLDAEDKITLSKTCYELHDWVASKRTSFYFSQVVPVIALRTTKLKARDILQYASCILKCRTICKSWTSDFNRVFPAHPAHLRLCTEEDGADGGALDICNIDNRFGSSEQMQRFLQEMHSHQGNPFPGRSIMLGNPFRYEAFYGTKANRLSYFRDYFAKTIELLQVFGCEIHMADFDFRRCDKRRELQVLEIYKYFRSCLVYMPNLKKLVVCGRNNSTDCEEHLAFYKENPLPQLPYLEMVDLSMTSRAIWNGVLESCCVPLNIKRLLLYYKEQDEMEHPRIPEAASFPNLEAFHLKPVCAELERFVNVLQRAPIPPVNTLELHHWMPNEEDFGRVFRNFEVFAGSLTFLFLQDSNFSEDSLRHAIATRFAVNLPKLERLILINYTGPLDPFCQLPSLKYLRINSSPFRVWDGSKVDFYGFEERMDESNIWEKIPSLQEFNFESDDNVIDKTYHRNML